MLECLANVNVDRNMIAWCFFERYTGYSEFLDTLSLSQIGIA
ncbi:hypothetical protein [Vibrio sp. B1Z05]|nr:hypothetical protein [Vibrio sp. B1Z05]